MSAPENASLKPGATATFKCKYDGNPRPDVKWYKGSKQIKDADRYILTNKSQVATLEIDDVNASDDGEYRVLVTNEYGDAEHSFNLSVASAKSTSNESTAKSKSFLLVMRLEVASLQALLIRFLFHITRNLS